MMARVALVGIALLVLIVPVPSRAQDAAPAATDLDKPLQQFTIGDLFPKVTSESTKSIGEDWKTSAATLEKVATDRVKAIDQAVAAKKANVAQLKSELKAANKEKDFVKAGTIEGTLKSDEMTKKVLELIKKLSTTQAGFAESWSDVGDALVKFVEEDNKFDTVRAKEISKPAPGAEDKRLDASGVQAMKAHAAAAKDLGKAFSDLGSKIQAVGSSRLSLLSQLEKSGQVQPPK